MSIYHTLKGDSYARKEESSQEGCQEVKEVDKRVGSPQLQVWSTEAINTYLLPLEREDPSHSI